MGNVCFWGIWVKVYGNSLYYLCNFSENLKLLNKKKRCKLFKLKWLSQMPPLPGSPSQMRSHLAHLALWWHGPQLSRNSLKASSFSSRGAQLDNSRVHKSGPQCCCCHFPSVGPWSLRLLLTPDFPLINDHEMFFAQLSRGTHNNACHDSDSRGSSVNVNSLFSLFSGIGLSPSLGHG